MAHQKGKEQLITFVEERLMPCGDKQVKFSHILPRNKPLSFSSLYEVEQKKSTINPQKVIKTDRNLVERLITAFQSRRDVILKDILKHEPMPSL
ncbi:hypothetical protein Hamer_G003202 [Homarus americanus]|uniref:Uncharacterized protein n=1 Tax=Homarus americanus TaxID=6706 RepID=A0A8J5N7Y7_HOMAM|nr:hypothetical protein Hamer_G003202 [Homarus americanus]